MPSAKTLYHYLDDGVSFVFPGAARLSIIYFPLCGIDAAGIKSAVSPVLSGDIKIDSSRYLTKPASTEDLRNGLRDFFCRVEGRGVVSLARPRARGAGRDLAAVEAGPLWHKLTRTDPRAGLEMEAVNFVPVTGENVELMRVSVRNVSKKTLTITPTFSLPVFARVLANKHDHEHVTSLFNRIAQLPQGVLVEPTMIFNEHGHRINRTVYYVFGRADGGDYPEGTFPTVESFYGEGGPWFAPEAVMEDRAPAALPKAALDGKEAAGALRFKKIRLAPGKAREYLIVMGIASSRPEAAQAFRRFNSPEKFEAALRRNRKFWTQKSASVCFETEDKAFDSWMRWVTIQPVLRRIFGCSFLPDHDYGKGGKGWRDLWQDLLSLILIEPSSVRENLINNFGGVRTDGSNATIIGSAPGEFLADRNAISRVWMDHGAWPFLTLLLYIDQTGDDDILFERQTYFRDPQIFRAQRYDHGWTPRDGGRVTDKNNRPYEGTILEHVLIQNLVQFFNVGEHNIVRLENADWNDGLDMAAARGESVAFMSLYAGNLLRCADLLERTARRKNIHEVTLAREVLILLDSVSGFTETHALDYADVAGKRKLLFERYFPATQPQISGEQVNVGIEDVVRDLRRKGDWIVRHIRDQEKVQAGPVKGGALSGASSCRWFNGYYDNQGERVEGKKEGVVRMTLTGQVFPVMSGVAGEKEIEEIVQAVRRYLKDKRLGGYRLNTDFRVPHYMELGRAFGFAYGAKENGSFFSHMAVMYAYALYKRNFARDGNDVIQSIFRMAANTEKSKIYPGIPEYFDSLGRGRYHYLTGSASWLVLTMLTQVFGVHGEGGDLVLAPQLLKEQFDRDGKASVACFFAGKRLSVTYLNERLLDFGAYAVKEVSAMGNPVACTVLSPVKVRIPRGLIEQYGQPELELAVRLG